MKDEDYVSNDVALLLNEKGYDEPSMMVLSDLNRRCLYATDVNIHDLSHGSMLIPSLYDAQKWLREKYNIEVVLDVNYSLNEGLYYYFGVFNIKNRDAFCKSIKIYTKRMLCPENELRYQTYEEALNEGIKEALEYI